MNQSILPPADGAPDPHEDFLRLFLRHEAELRVFVHACLPRSTDVDEVMQEVSLVAWRKFSTLADKTQFARWACIIARFEVMKHRRAHARDRLVLDEDIIDKLAAQAQEDSPRRNRQLLALDGCVAKLPRERRELTLAAYTPGASMRDLAAQVGRTEGSLYQLLARIRQELLRCVERTIAAETFSL